MGVEGHNLAGVASRLLGREPERVHAAQHLLARLSERLAGFGDDEPGEFLVVPLHPRSAVLEHAGTFMAG
jgi:hypothetical protein